MVGPNDDKSAVVIGLRSVSHCHLKFVIGGHLKLFIGPRLCERFNKMFP